MIFDRLPAERVTNMGGKAVEMPAGFDMHVFGYVPACKVVNLSVAVQSEFFGIEQLSLELEKSE